MLISIALSISIACCVQEIENHSIKIYHVYRKWQPWQKILHAGSCESWQPIKCNAAYRRWTIFTTGSRRIHIFETGRISKKRCLNDDMIIMTVTVFLTSVGTNRRSPKKWKRLCRRKWNARRRVGANLPSSARPPSVSRWRVVLPHTRTSLGRWKTCCTTNVAVR